jgi:hypothetical protein
MWSARKAQRRDARREERQRRAVRRRDRATWPAPCPRDERGSASSGTEKRPHSHCCCLSRSTPRDGRLRHRDTLLSSVGASWLPLLATCRPASEARRLPGGPDLKAATARLGRGGAICAVGAEPEPSARVPGGIEARAGRRWPPSTSTLASRSARHPPPCYGAYSLAATCFGL